jgi:Tfp pilus assembly protein PilF
MRRWLLMFGVLLLAAGAALGDTIVLKSGRRITATHVEEEGDRVYYETPAGRFSFPKSSVERIERGGTATFASGVDALPAVSAPPIPPVEGYDEIAKAAVKNGVVDRGYLAQLETEARNGGERAVSRAVGAYHAAALNEFGKNNFDAAIEYYERALRLAPEHLGVLLNLSHLYLRKSEFTKALDFLERAERNNSQNADVAKLMGWAYYGQNKLEQAARQLRRAYALRPDAETQRALAKVERDLQTEEKFKENESAHFQLRYDGEAAPGLAREVLRELEAHFERVASELNFRPREPIGVVLYTAQAFYDVTQAPGWVGALNDGRIRLPVQGLSSMTAKLSSTLMHELVHSFVFQKSRGRCPVWLNEGLAQWFQGRRSDQTAGGLMQLAADGRFVSLVKLEGFWSRFDAGTAAYAYAVSLAAVEFLIAQNGMRDIERLLDLLPTAASPAAALREVLRTDYPELDAETIQYLKRNYSR